MPRISTFGFVSVSSIVVTIASSKTFGLPVYSANDMPNPASLQAYVFQGGSSCGSADLRHASDCFFPNIAHDGMLLSIMPAIAVILYTGSEQKYCFTVCRARYALPDLPIHKSEVGWAKRSVPNGLCRITDLCKVVEQEHSS
ncbi:hypothetical protein, partial [Thiolapillus sp.]